MTRTNPPTPARLCFLDIESTGLGDEHEPWEIGLIVREPNGVADVAMRWYIRPEDLDVADPAALRINRYHERTAAIPGLAIPAHQAIGADRWAYPVNLAEFLAELTAGAVIIGSNVGFDMRMLGRWMRRQGYQPTWHYRPVDVGGLAYGYLTASGRQPAGGLPWSSATLAAALGVERTGPAHEALPDAMYARDVHDAVTSTPASQVDLVPTSDDYIASFEAAQRWGWHPPAGATRAMLDTYAARLAERMPELGPAAPPTTDDVTAAVDAVAARWNTAAWASGTADLRGWAAAIIGADRARRGQPAAMPDPTTAEVNGLVALWRKLPAGMSEHGIVTSLATMLIAERNGGTALAELAPQADPMPAHLAALDTAHGLRRTGGAV